LLGVRRRPERRSLFGAISRAFSERPQKRESALIVDAGICQAATDDELQQSKDKEGSKKKERARIRSFGWN